MKWKRPSGSEIETNDAESTIDSCNAMGWEPIECTPQEEPVPEEWGSSEPGEESPPEPEVPESPKKRRRGR